MKIISSSINWHEGYANHPTLEVEVDTDLDTFFDHDAPIWRAQDNGLVWAIDTESGIIEYLYMGNGMTSHQPFKGYGGREMFRRLRNGDIVRSNDCWSSRCSQLYLACSEVTIQHSTYGLRIHEWATWVKAAGAHPIINADGDYLISRAMDRYTKEVN